MADIFFIFRQGRPSLSRVYGREGPRPSMVDGSQRARYGPALFFLFAKGIVVYA